MKLYTIGFTKRSAGDFSKVLQGAQVSRMIDVRLNNVSQLAGFAKRDDLAYFLRAIVGASYMHYLDFAPTPEMLDSYRKGRLSCERYEEKFCGLLSSRSVERAAADLLRNGDCLLCSELTAHRCHRRLVVDYLKEKGLGFEVVHL